MRLTTMAGVVTAAGVLTAGAAHAQSAGNAAYQDYFRRACIGSSGQLNGLCVASRGGELSGDSESSLNPNQTGVANSNALNRAQALAAVTEARLAALREDGAATEAAAIGPGGFSLFASGQIEGSNQDRGPYDNERGFEGDARRITVGLDRRFGSGALGASLTHSDYGSDFVANRPGNAFTPGADAGGIDSKDVNVTVFATFAPAPNAWVDASLGLAWANYDFRRNAVF